MSTTDIRTHVLLRSEETDGAVSIVENVLPAGMKGPHLHTHDFDETFYVMDGEITFQVEDELITRGPGEIAFAPRTSRTRWPTAAAPRALRARVHAGRLRALLRADGGQAGGHRAARVGARPDPRGHAGRPADRRAGLTG